MNKIRHYFSTLEITRGFFIALLGSAFIYLNHWGLSHPFFNTIFALGSLFLLLRSDTKTWFWFGVFSGIFWFWWIALSLQHYGYHWGFFVVGLFFLGWVYGTIFGFIAWLSQKIASLLTPYPNHFVWVHSSLITLALKAIGLLLLSYLHPFGFDWLKPELPFIESYLGIEKWQYAIVLLSIILTIWKQKFYYLFLVLGAYSPLLHQTLQFPQDIQLVTTHTTVKNKWDTSLQPKQFEEILTSINHAIDNNKSLIILPESVFPVFLNRSAVLMHTLKEKSNTISIVTGGLYLDGKIPRNSTYIFTKGKVRIANKVVLVPFGESNPLPGFLSKWVNDVFYDGAIDYEASSDIIDYQIDGVSYRNAICFEATSEKLYEEPPKQMIVLSNNGWFYPSIEPTLQKLLLLYYNKKYGTTIYHSVNMSESYLIQNKKVLMPNN